MGTPRHLWCLGLIKLLWMRKYNEQSAWDSKWGQWVELGAEILLQLEQSETTSCEFYDSLIFLLLLSFATECLENMSLPVISLSFSPSSPIFAYHLLYNRWGPAGPGDLFNILTDTNLPTAVTHSRTGCLSLCTISAIATSIMLIIISVASPSCLVKT